ncbi:MAG: glycosyltransferase, partial [Alphaproteobacteria bacterium]|nr:glycosyltransferase [Alphaproteobacteria bacterium]
LATGEYIGFCDSDDYVDVDYYENLYKKAHETDSEIVYCGCIVENEKTGRVKYCQLRFSERNELPLLEHLNNGTNWNGLFLRDFINENKLCFPTSSSSIYKDICFSAPAILKAKRTAITTEVFYHYVIHDKSTTIGISKKQHCQATFEVLKEIGEKITPPIETLEKAFIHFLFRALSLGSLDSFPQEISFLSNTPLWQDLYKKQRTFSNPTWQKRLFSISHHLTKPIIKIRILGISFKMKKKEKKS